MPPRRPQLRAILRMKQGNRCCYCGVVMVISQKTVNRPPNAETLEHLRRLADGGTNSRDNIALACFRCNTERGGLDWLSYTTYRRGEFYD